MAKCHQCMQKEDDEARKVSAPYYTSRLRELRTAIVTAAARADLHALHNNDVLKFWHAVDERLIPPSISEHQTFVLFNVTICALFGVQASSASSERAVSAAKFVLDGHYSLDDAKFERAVVMRSYISRHSADEKAFATLVKKVADEVRRARAKAASAPAKE